MKMDEYKDIDLSIRFEEKIFFLLFNLMMICNTNNIC